MQDKSRVDYIDVAKGFAIMLMVFGHCYSVYSRTLCMIWVYSFHMPLFFISAGVLYGIKAKNEKIEYNFKKKIKSLLLPYFLWNTLYQLFVSTLSIVGGKPLRETLFDNLSAVVKLGGSAMWFLPAMFIASFIFLKSVNNMYINILIVFSTALIGLLCSKCNDYIEAFLRSFIGLTYIAIGFYTVRFYTTKCKKIQSLFIMIVVNMILAFSNGIVSIASREFNNPLLYIINGCFGTYIAFQVAMFLDRQYFIFRLLQYWGKNSIKILCLHGFAIQIIRLLDYKLFGEFLPRLGYIEGFIFTAIVMNILTIAMPMINKYFNWTFGIKNHNN